MLRKVDRFPYSFSRVDELPGAVAEAVRAAGGDENIINIILLPPQEHARPYLGKLGRFLFTWEETPTWTMVFSEKQLTFVSCTADQQIQTIVVPVQEIVSIEIATILLYACVELHWVQSSHIEGLKIEFNAVGERMIRMYLDRIRPLVAPRASEDEKSGLPLPELALKFRNYLRLALLPDERLREVAFQPAIYGHGRWFRTQLAQRRTIAVTDRHVLFIEDDPRPRNTYGVITRYVPLVKIKQVTLDAMDEWTWLRLEIGSGLATRELAVPLDPESAVRLADTICRELAIQSVRDIQSYRDLKAQITDN